MKRVQITKGEYTWEFPLSVIAQNRAKYYAETDPDTTFKEEFDHAMSDASDAMDWFLGNMDLTEVPIDEVRLVSQPTQPPRFHDLNHYDGSCEVEVIEE